MRSSSRPSRAVAFGTACLLCAVAATALTACSGHAQVASRPAPPPPQTVAAQPGAVHPTEVLPGIVAPAQNVIISSTLAEPASAVLVQEGQTVRRGQVLAVLQTDDLRASLEAAQRSYAEAEAKTAQTQYQAQLAISQGGDQVQSARGALLQARATLAQAQSVYERDKALYAAGAIAQQDLQQQASVVANDEGAVQSAEAQLSSAIAAQRANGTETAGLQAANIAAARAAAAVARAQIDQIQTQIVRATISSPVDGIVVNRNLNPGEYPGTRQLFVLQDVSTVYAILNAAGNQTVNVPTGAPVTVTTSSLGGRTFDGRVVAVLDQAMPGSTNFTVKVALANPLHLLRSGLAVTGRIALPAVQGIAIPVTAFLDDSRTTVLVASGASSQVAQVHELAADDSTAIVSGLATGAQVVVNGQQGSPASPGSSGR